MHDRIADNRSRPYHPMEIRRRKRQSRYILWKIPNRCIRIIQILPKKKMVKIQSINQGQPQTMTCKHKKKEKKGLKTTSTRSKKKGGGKRKEKKKKKTYDEITPIPNQSTHIPFISNRNIPNHISQSNQMHNPSSSTLLLTSQHTLIRKPISFR